MSHDLQPNFEDPALKAALKRTIGTETAPADLRQRVAQAIAAEGQTPSTGAAESRVERPAEPGSARSMRIGWRRSPLIGLAAAAMLIVGVGLIFNHLWEPGIDNLYTLPKALAADMVATHDRMLGSGIGGPIEVVKDDLGRVRDTLKEKLGHPVLVASLGAGWEMQGAGVSKIGETPAAHVVFRNKSSNEVVSVFSVSAAAYYAGQDGMEYAQVEQGHPIAGFVQNGVVHCIVGSPGSKLDEDDLAKLRNAVRKTMSDSSSSCSQPEESLANL